MLGLPGPRVLELPVPLRGLEPVDLEDLEDETEQPEADKETLDQELDRAAREIPAKQGSIESEEGERF